MLRPLLRTLLASVALLTAIAAGTAPASAAQTTVTRAVSGSVTAGHTLRMSASLHAGNTPVRGARVDLFRIVPSGREKVATLTTNAAGSVSATVRPTATGRWYWRFAGSASYGASGTRVTVRVTTPPPAPKVKPLGERAVVEAAPPLGAPYVYGATGPRSFDCSGFARYVYERLGVSLPRTAAQQYGAVRHVAVGARQPGDLIFFRLGGGGIDHVGIYAGNNTIIVAPKSRGPREVRGDLDLVPGRPGRLSPPTATWRTHWRVSSVSPPLGGKRSRVGGQTARHAVRHANAAATWRREGGRASSRAPGRRGRGSEGARVREAGCPGGARCLRMWWVVVRRWRTEGFAPIVVVVISTRAFSYGYRLPVAV